MRLLVSLTLLVISLAAASATAQKLVWSPAGSSNLPGNTNNTIPFWSESATYQQVHDDVDLIALNNGAPLVMTGLGLRKAVSSSTTAARTIDLQLTVGVTSVSAAAATATFATNLGPSPTVVHAWGPVNLPALSQQSSPNPIGFLLPFNAPFPVPAASGSHFCWEWRHANGTVKTSMAMDANNATGVVTGLEGAGCVATGQTLAATVSTRSLSLTTRAFRNMMTRGPANAAAVYFVGLTRQAIGLPGLCSQLELLPVLSLAGTTNATGQFDVQVNLAGVAVGMAQLEILGQFAFADASLPLGVGLSDMAFVRTPFTTSAGLCRIYAAPSQGTGGNETATTGSVGRNFGLVTAFQIP